MDKEQANQGVWLVVAVVVGLLIFLSSLDSGDTPSQDTTPQPAKETPVVFPNIESEADCGILQDIFDNAEHAGDGARERGDLDLARAHTDAMARADERMSDVGCYD